MSEICRFCFPNKSFPTVDDLKAHFTNEHKYRCNFCFIHFGSSYTWILHHDVEHKDRCPYCAAFIGAKRDEHLTQVHQYHPCCICSACYASADDLELHYGNPLGTHPFRCNQCKRELMNHRDFWVHCYDLHRDKCPLCDAKLKANINDKVQWEDHLRTAHRLLPCPECFEVFQAEEQYNNHYRSKHQYSCVYCQCCFPNKAETAEHVTSAHKIKCSICQQMFATDLEFQHHYNDSHRIKCEICHVTCPDEASKVAHVNGAHRIQCLLCGEFLAKEMVEVHLNCKHAIGAVKEEHYNAVHREAYNTKQLRLHNDDSAGQTEQV